MTLPFSWFLAFKYMRPKRTFLSVVTVISILGILLGVAVLLVVISVMTGFDLTWRDKILGFSAHVRVTGDGFIRNEKALVETISRVEGVTGASPVIEDWVYVSHGDYGFTPKLRGIDPRREAGISDVPANMVAGEFSVSGNRVVLGTKLARRLGAGVGDVLLVYSPQSFTKADSLRLPVEVEVAGLFQVGKFDLDNGYLLSSLGTARDAFAMREGVHAIHAMTADPDAAAEVAGRIREAVGPPHLVESWMEMYRELFGALRAEKNMMYFLLIIISVVAAFNVTNTLITQTVQKTREIGLLKAVGCPTGGVVRVFVWQGVVAGAIGTVFGLATGFLLLHYRNDLLQYLNRRGMQLLPEEIYQLSEIPSRTMPQDLAAIVVAVMVISTLAGVVPAYRAARLDPARALRYE
jgi:lipoprotein-releasing system permease protein